MTLVALQTERLTLRAPCLRDAPVVAKVLNNFDISQWLTMVPFPYGITDAEWFINEAAKGNFSVYFIWQQDILIGAMGVDDGLGYWLAQDHWGKGYATEAGQAVLTHYFATTDADKTTASYFEGNAASCNVLTKLGFVGVGADVHFSKARAAHVSVRNMELTRSRWNALQNG